MTEAGSPFKLMLYWAEMICCTPETTDELAYGFGACGSLLSVCVFAMAPAPHTLRQVARPHTHTAARIRRSSSHPLQQPPALKD